MLIPVFMSDQSSDRVGCCGSRRQSPCWFNPQRFRTCPQSTGRNGHNVAAAFLPLYMMGPGEPTTCRDSRNPCHRNVSNTCQMPSCATQPAGRPVFDDTSDLVQNLLENLFGVKHIDVEQKGHEQHEETDGFPAPSTNKSKTESSASSPDHISHNEGLNGDDKHREPGSPVKPEEETRKTEEEHADDGEERAMWSHSLSLRRFAPTQVRVMLQGDKLRVHTVHEKSRGYGTSRFESIHTITLPEDVDRHNLVYSMKPGCTLYFRAPRLRDSALETKGMKSEAVEDKAEKVEVSENTTKMNTEDMKDEACAIQKADTVEGSVRPLTQLASEKISDQLLESATVVDEKTEGDDAAPKSHDPDSSVITENQTAAKEDSASHPLIQEPNDEPSSDDNKVKAIFHQQSPDEDFVVIVGVADENIVGTDEKDDLKSQGDRLTESHEDQVNEDQTLGEQSEVRDGPTRTLSRTDCCKKPEAEREDTEDIQGHCNETEDIEEHSPESSSEHDTLQSRAEPGAFHAALPLDGFSPRDIQVKLEGHTLRITAQRQVSLGEASYTESVERQVHLPGHLDVTTVRCVYQDNGCLVITASSARDHRQVPVELMSL